MSMRKLLHQYNGKDRFARVYYNTEQGYEVDLSDSVKGFLETRKLYGHSESYAEDCAENFVLGVFDV